jgi:serine phosphatase RsbU (regulator of sigma subunit)
MYLKAGDIVVMVTDGICDEEYIWLENLIMRYCDRTPKEICRFILKEVEENNPLPDDRTIMVGRVVTNG